MTKTKPQYLKQQQDQQKGWKALGLCFQCGKQPRGTTLRCETCRVRHAIYQQTEASILNRSINNLNRKIDLFNHYGGCVCTCCGETEVTFLTIDHINNDGAKLRKDFKGHDNLKWWLPKHNYPEGYQVLCMNCNWAKGVFGICPHQNKLNMHQAIV